MTDPVVVVGGGLAGLVAAIYAAQEGRPAVLLESVSELGGRARTREERGFHFNMGPHALYNGSAAAEILRELGVEVAGGVPSTSGALALRGGAVHALPGGFVSLLTSGLLGLGEKLAFARFYQALPRLDTAQWNHVPLDEALEQLVPAPRVRDLVRALTRVATYAHAPRAMSAGAALRQVQLAGAGVRYLDRGWASLVSALRDVAERSGVQLRTGARARAVEGFPRASGVVLQSGERIAASAVVLALAPDAAASLVRGADGAPDPVLARLAAELVPVRAACLDVALERLPRPRARFLLGLDEPLYYSVHTASARLGPAGGALIHVASYLAPGEETGRDAVHARLEGILGQLQPGWRDVVVSQRFARDLTVSHALPTAAMGGLAGRPGPLLPHRPGLVLAGDWVGPVGQLADASFASGREAGRLAVDAARLARAA